MTVWSHSLVKLIPFPAFQFKNILQITQREREKLQQISIFNCLSNFERS